MVSKNLVFQIEMPKVKNEPGTQAGSQSWTNKSNNNDNDFFDPNESQNILLGRNRYTTRFQGEKTLHIRKMRDSRGKLCFTKEGVNLTREEWRTIKSKVTTFESFLVSYLS